MTGEVTVKFLDQIRMPQINFTQVFNNSVFNVTIRPSAYSNPLKLNFTWNCTGLNSNYMYLKLIFEHPLDISFIVSMLLSYLNYCRM